VPESQERVLPPVTARLELRADCSRCSALCCVALPFSASVEFAVDKDAGTPCRNLREDSGCGIHAELRPRGFSGCTAYDCFGAGQHVTQVLYGGRTWRQEPGAAPEVFAVFSLVQHLHEMLWYLTEVLELAPARALHPEARELRDDLERFSRDSPDAVLQVDVGAHRRRVGALVVRVSAAVRSGVGEEPGRRGKGRGKDRRGADLTGARLAGSDLRGADLRAAQLLGADLRRADLRLVDLLGADLRGADLSGADLSSSLFLTQPQVGAARGDERTRLPAALTRPTHW
jgi:hypothetical protein